MTEGDSTTTELVVFLHGLGDGPESWDAQIAALPDGFVGVAPSIPGTRDADQVEFTLDTAGTAITRELDARGLDRAHICGLSLGGMIATRYAIANPERVASLVLSGSQLRPNRALIAMQTAFIRVLPRQYDDPPGMGRETLLSVLDGVREVDLRPDLAKIAVPTLVLCGSKDRANLKAASALAAGIPGAELEVVDGVGRGWHTDEPARFAARLSAFLQEVAAERQ